MDDDRRPCRFMTPSSRMSDDLSDILEAEFFHDDRVDERAGSRAPRAYDEIRHCYDESQALEVLSVEPGWLHGERFYILKPPGFEDDEMFIQDFGLLRATEKRPAVFWMSIIEDERIPSEEADKRCGTGRFWDVILQGLVKWNVLQSLNGMDLASDAPQTP